MMQVLCPWCGVRDEDEFTYGGPAHITRPTSGGDAPQQDVSDEKWASYLYEKDNVKGIARERWVHVHGCGQWFNLARDTVSHKIHCVYKMGEPCPVLTPEGDPKNRND
ncbi:MAG: sarcosine oxidase subunit delta [Alphaproteobacteria bacterium]|nr:MAG: sarcosine oxidase subunit delta [Alphaproteobacteria bacterium]